MTISPWWERFPGLLESELAAVDAAGIDYDLDDEARRERGVIRIRLKVPVGEERIGLVATYPDLYPYFRFEVQAPDVLLGRHQHPFGRTLCLIGRRTENWQVDDSLAAFIRERLPLTIDTAREPDSDEATENEEHQGEPFTDYYTYQAHAALLVDSSWDLRASGGELTIGLVGTAPHPQIPRGAILSVGNEHGAEIAVADHRLHALFPKMISGRWVRLAEPPNADSADAVLATMVAEDPALAELKWQKPYGERLDIAAAVFPEEIRWRASGDAWLFVVRRSVPPHERLK